MPEPRLGNFSPLSKERELGLIDQEIARRQSPATPIPSPSRTDRRLTLIDQEIAKRKEAAPKVKERGVIGELAAGFGRGALGVVAAPAEIADIAGEAIGWEALEKAGESGAKAIEKYIKESPKLKRTESISKNILKNPELWKDPRWYSSIVGEGLPTILSMFIPGMAAAKAAKVAKLGAKGVRAARIAGGLTAGVGLEAAGAASDVRQYEEQTGEAIPISTKLQSVLGTGIVAGSLEYVPIFAMFGKAGASKLVSRVLTGMATEGTTEGAQELVANAFAKAGYDADQNMVDGVVESIVGGVLLGGGMGAVSRATNFKERVDETTPEEVSEILEQTETEAKIPEEQQAEFTRRREETALRTAEERQAAIEAAAPMTTASDETTTLAEEAPRPEPVTEEIVPEEVVPEEIPLVPEAIPAPLRAMGMRPAPVKPAVEKAVVPFMITKKTEAGLSKLGYTKEDIVKMSPEDALGIVEAKITKEPVAEEKVVEPEAPEKIEIPTLTDTTQAIAFGKKATPEQITELKRLRKESEARYDVLIKEDKLDEAGEEALKAQLFREAFEAKEKPIEPKVEKPKVAEKEPWEMTFKETWKEMSGREFNKYAQKIVSDKYEWYEKHPSTDAKVRHEDLHETIIEKALSEGKPVPKEVLAEYPDLAPAKPVTPKPPKPKPPEAVEKEIKVKPIPEVAPKKEILDKTISYDKNNIRGWFVDPKDWDNNQRLTYREVANKIAKDKDIKFKIEEKLVDPDKILGETTKHYIAYLENKRLREFPKGVYDLVQEISVKKKPISEPIPKPKKEPKVEVAVEKAPTKPEPGFAWIKGKQKPILSAREIAKGKNKGKYEVTLTKGRDEEGNIIPGAKKIVTEKEIITMPEEKIEVAPVEKAKVIKPAIPGVKPKVKKVEKIEVAPEVTIKERQKIATEKYSPVFGTRVETPDGFTWELKSVNDLGVPYFSKVVKGKIQKKEFTVTGFEKEWIDEQVKIALEIEVTPIEEAKANIKASTTEILKGERGSFSTKTKEGAATFEDFSVVGKDFIKRGADTFVKFTEQMKKTFGEVWESVKHLAKELYTRAKAILTEERGEITIREEAPKIEKLTFAEKALGLKPKKPLPTFKETTEPIVEKDYIANRKIKKDVSALTAMGIKRVKAEVAEGLDKFFGAISTRLGNVSPKLKAKVRKLDFDTNTKYATDVKTVEPLLRKAKKMNRDDFADWDYARKNSDVTKIYELVNKYGMQKEYESYRKKLDSVRKEAMDVGLEIGEIQEYAPRILKDTKGFLTAIGKAPEWPLYSRKIQERAQELDIPVSKMPADMRADIISNIILGGYTGLSGVPATKERRLRKIPASLNRYYMDSDAALMQHLFSMRKLVEARKFFGKIPEKVAEIRKRLHNAQATGNTKLEKEYTAYLAKYALQRDYTENIGAYIDDLIIKKEITPEQERIVNEILTARFHEKGTRGLIQAYKNISYIDTMGSPVSALTQIGDLAWSMYEGGVIRTLKHAYKAARGKSRITKEDVGVERIAQEFADSGALGGAVSKVFKIVGLEKIDTIGKEALLNTALDKYQKQAKADPSKLRKEIESIFEDETNSVIDDLINNKISENVKLLVYSRLLDFQPVGLSEMPQKYLDAGNGRLFYMLKTFTLKVFDVFRNESYNKIKTGDRTEKIEGMKNLARLSMFFVLANAGADELKDLILGRETDIEDRVVDNILRLFGVSKFVTWKARTEGVGSALARQILPPFKFVDSASKDIITLGDEKGLETVGSIPVIGKLAYWHIGRGTTKREELLSKRLRKEATRTLMEGIVGKEIERLHDLDLLPYPIMPAKSMTIAGKRFEFNEEQYNMLVTESGQASKKKLDSLVGTKYWGMLSDKEKASRIQKIIKDNRKKARNKIKKEFKVAIPGMVPWKKTKKKKRPAWQVTAFGKIAGWQKPMEF